MGMFHSCRQYPGVLDLFSLAGTLLVRFIDIFLSVHLWVHFAVSLAGCWLFGWPGYSLHEWLFWFVPLLYVWLRPTGKNYASYSQYISSYCEQLDGGRTKRKEIKGMGSNNKDSQIFVLEHISGIVLLDSSLLRVRDSRKVTVARKSQREVACFAARLLNAVQTKFEIPH
jgi:hypothetical protein